MKFKIGDKVRILNADGGQFGCEHCVGKVYAITGIDDGMYILGDAHPSYYWDKDRLELVEEKKFEPKFKDGDRVRVTCALGKRTWIKPLVGIEATVLKSFKCANPDKCCYDIGEEYLLSEDELERIEEKKPEPKFKVGDKVRVVRARGDHKAYLGETHTIKTINPNARFWNNHPRLSGTNHYGVGGIYVVYEDQLELVKPKFDINDYPGKCVMHVTTEDQAKIFCEYLDSVGKKWHNGDQYLNNTTFYVWHDSTCYNFNFGARSHIGYYRNNAYTILEFENFDLSDFMSKKEFTKKDLKNGDVVKLKDGTIGIAIPDIKCVLFTGGQMNMDFLSDDMLYRYNHDCDITEVRRPSSYDGCSFDGFKDHRIDDNTLVYERYPKVEEMTLEEVCKALGKEIKIVKNK